MAHGMMINVLFAGRLSVLTELVGINKEWSLLATVLDIPKHDIKEIEINHPQDVRRCLVEMVDKWLELQASQVSWTTLCQALRHPLVGRTDIAEAIEHKYRV